MGSTKEKLLRTIDILKSTDEQHPITAKRIIELLSSYGLEPERKSVLRDIQLLREYGYDIEYAKDNKEGMYLGDREFEDWELKVLIDAVQSAGFLNQADTDKLINKLCDQTSDDTRRTLRFMMIPGNAKTGDKSVKNSIDTVLHAMRRHNKVHFSYVYTDDSGNTVQKHPEGTSPVSPYALIWRHDRYYLIGCYDTGVGLSYYRLDRIRSMKELACEKAVPLETILGSNASMKLKQFVNQNIYNKKGKVIRLRLALNTNGRNEVLDTCGDEANIIMNPDGTVDAYMSVSDSEGLYQWLLEHGRYFTVIEPAEVREKLVARLDEIRGNYENAEKNRKPMDVLALEYATKYHAGKFNDNPPLPVICHPIAVAERVEGEKEKAVAYLHDVLEDTEATEAEMRALFGDEITDAVVTDTRREGESYWDYLERVKKNPLALKVKLADLEHNLERETDRTSERFKKHKKAYDELIHFV